MTLEQLAPIVVLLIGGGLSGLGACNAAALGDCPASITQGGKCDNEALECPYTLTTPASCSGVQTSCTCTSGAWSCPAPTDCTTEGGPSDAPLTESAAETSPVSDGGLNDIVIPDTSFEPPAFESGPADTGPNDTGPSDTGPSDTGPADTSATDGSKDAAKSPG